MGGARDAENATRDLTPVRLSEVVLRTARSDEMNAWYQAVLGVDPYLQNVPQAELVRIE